MAFKCWDKTAFYVWKLLHTAERHSRLGSPARIGDLKVCHVLERLPSALTRRAPSPPIALPHTMNTLVSRYSTTTAESEIRKAKAAAVEDGDFSDAMWGSDAGFGSLAQGVPMFKTPSVVDVRVSNIALA